MDPVMSVWDAAALQPILEEAGGTFTDWQGNGTIYHGEGIGTNRRVLEEVLSHMTTFPARLMHNAQAPCGAFLASHLY